MSALQHDDPGRVRLVARLAIALFVFLVIAGCHGPTEVDEDHGLNAYRIAGAFTENATQDDIDGLRARLAPYGADLVVLESFPMQYHVDGIRAHDCDEVRSILTTEPAVATVGPCEAASAPQDGDSPTTET